jgi:SpoVK/Ycf46/Vps4 family AAA+-type ATPase
MVCYDHGDVFLTDLGYVHHHTFQPINYTADIRAGFDFITTNLATPIPNGRLYVLYGLPGTGKSYYIRSVIAHTQAIYVYVPPSLVPRLTSPDLIGVLLRARDTQDYHIPICLILEDADSSLVQRAMDNANLVGDLLNLSDGFLGELANLHIFATVNAKKTDIDPALLRPGRLGVYLAFHALDRSHAWEVFTTLCTEAQVDPSAPAYTDACAALSARYERPSTQATLADVYALARQAGWTPSSRPKTPTPPAPLGARHRASSDGEAPW